LPQRYPAKLAVASFDAQKDETVEDVVNAEVPRPRFEHFSFARHPIRIEGEIACRGRADARRAAAGANCQLAGYCRKRTKERGTLAVRERIVENVLHVRVQDEVPERASFREFPESGDALGNHGRNGGARKSRKFQAHEWGPVVDDPTVSSRMTSDHCTDVLGSRCGRRRKEHSSSQREGSAGSGPPLDPELAALVLLDAALGVTLEALLAFIPELDPSSRTWAEVTPAILAAREIIVHSRHLRDLVQDYRRKLNQPYPDDDNTF
jgi:hypothetical protein